MNQNLKDLIKFIQNKHSEISNKWKENENYKNQWELQIWNKEDEERNINSHKIYKQDYTRWEIENKGGKI